ncbi:mitochondrial carrier [Neoconidiobolus thromboides FSU 785]|nr:mitochondrial carrier [Neoconidiobolus thromboides FSU 785]
MSNQLSEKQTSFSGSYALDQSIAGLTAGAISTLLLHPMDLIKTKIQADDFKKLENKRIIGRSISAIKSVIKTDSLLGLYRGLSPNLVGSALSWSFYFGWYSIIKQQYHSDLGDGRISNKLSSTQYMLASAQAGALTVLCTNPIWVVKTRMLTSHKNQAGAYRGLVDGLIKLVQFEGIRGMYRGLTPALFGTSHGAVQFMVYEELKKWKSKKNLLKNKDIKLKDGLPVMDYLWMASLSKTMASILTYPYQVVKTRLQKQVDLKSNTEYKTTLDTISKIFKNEGIMGFYKGLGPNILRVLPGTCITFTVYESLSNYFRNGTFF